MRHGLLLQVSQNVVITVCSAMVLVSLTVFAAHLSNGNVISFPASLWSVQFLGAGL